jgi:hypothetical protein
VERSFPTAINYFLETTCDEKVAVFIQIALVARPEPRVGKGFFVGLWMVLVTRGDIRATDEDLPCRPADKNLPCSSTMAISEPVATPTEPALRWRGVVDYSLFGGTLPSSRKLH